jgi:hypothetical protein
MMKGDGSDSALRPRRPSASSCNDRFVVVATFRPSTAWVADRQAEFKRKKPCLLVLVGGASSRFSSGRTARVLAQ